MTRAQLKLKTEGFHIVRIGSNRYFWGEQGHAFCLTLIAVATDLTGDIGQYPKVTMDWLCHSRNPIEHLIAAIKFYGFPTNMTKTIPQVLQVVRDCGKYDDLKDAWLMSQAKRIQAEVM